MLKPTVKKLNVMPNILNISTSSNICSVGLAKDGEIIVGLESANPMDHSRSLAPFVKECMDYLKMHGEKLDAVSVDNGPGSYTGLRIGLSLAKGLAFGLDIPLITISSLQIMVVRAIFTFPDFSGEELIVPMIDARRMEVYTGVFNSSLTEEEKESAVILEDNTFDKLNKSAKVLFIGDGTEKFKPVYKGQNAYWLGKGMAHAKYMATLSEKYYREKIFSDVAYSVPSYLKAYQATTPKNKI